MLGQRQLYIAAYQLGTWADWLHFYASPALSLSEENNVAVGLPNVCRSIRLAAYTSVSATRCCISILARAAK